MESISSSVASSISSAFITVAVPRMSFMSCTHIHIHSQTPIAAAAFFKTSSPHRRTVTPTHMQMHPSIQSTPISRRHAITTTITTAFALLLPSILPYLVPSPAYAQDDESVRPPSITFNEFVQKLEAGQVSKVTFKGAQYDTAYATINDQVYSIGEGYPKENPITSESPLVLQAKLRDMKVKYEVDFGIPARKKKSQDQPQGQ